MLEHIMNLCFVDGFSGCRTNRANAIENASMNRHSQGSRNIWQSEPLEE